jgi:hypothetical protein
MKVNDLRKLNDGDNGRLINEIRWPKKEKESTVRNYYYYYYYTAGNAPYVSSFNNESQATW